MIVLENDRGFTIIVRNADSSGMEMEHVLHDLMVLDISPAISSWSEKIQNSTVQMAY